MGDNTGLNANALLEKLQQLEAQMEAFKQHQQAAPTPPPIGVAHRPHFFYRNRSPIIPPLIITNDYEINLELIQLVERKPFYGLSFENPMEHLERLERICSTTRVNGVPQDYIRCMLFEFSLADKATRWLNSLPPGSLVGWPAVRDAFLDYYFTKSKTAQLKAKISSFQQPYEESFCEAWERFTMYKWDCPHHGFTDTQLMNIFYNGVTWEYKTTLNVASNGNFMTRSVFDATILINNLAESCSDKSEGYDRGRGVNRIDSLKIDELNAKLDQLLQGHYQPPVVPNQAPMPQYQAPYQPPKEDSQDELKSMMQTLLTNQRKLAADINAKVDDMYKDLNSKFDVLSSHVKKLDTQVVQTADAIRRQPYILKGGPKANPRVEYVNVIKLRNDAPQLHHETAQEPSTKVSDSNTSDLVANSSDFVDVGGGKTSGKRSIFKRLVLRSIPNRTPAGEREYIPKVSYPDVLYQPKAFKKDASSISSCFEVKASSVEPTRHTMPWFEESYLPNSQLSC